MKIVLVTVRSSTPKAYFSDRQSDSQAKHRWSRAHFVILYHTINRRVCKKSTDGDGDDDCKKRSTDLSLQKMRAAVMVDFSITISWKAKQKMVKSGSWLPWAPSPPAGGIHAVCSRQLCCCHCSYRGVQTRKNGCNTSMTTGIITVNNAGIGKMYMRKVKLLRGDETKKMHRRCMTTFATKMTTRTKKILVKAFRFCKTF